MLTVFIGVNHPEIPARPLVEQLEDMVKNFSGPTISKKSDAVFKFVVKLSSGKARASELRKGSVFSNILSFNVPH